MNLRNNRYVVLIAALIINICLGSIYAWSILASQFKVENPEWTLTQIATAFSVLIMTYAITTIFAGRLQDNIGPRWVATAGGILMGSGVILSGLIPAMWGLYLGYSIIFGIGIGFSFVAPLACVVKWFPQEKRGLIVGLVTGIFGGGALVFGPLMAALINYTGTIYTTLVVIGSIYLIAVTLSAQFLNNPVVDEKPNEDNSAVMAEHCYTPGQMLKDKRFYVLWILFFLGGISGLTILSNAQQLAESFTGISGALLVSVISILSIFNALGSPAFGILSDKAGRKNALTSLFLICAAGLFLLPLTDNYIEFLLAASLVVLCYAGLFGIFPTVIADYYGTKNMGTNYGLLFVGYGAAALVGPGIAARFADNAKELAVKAGATTEQINTAIQSGYIQAIWIVGAACLLAVILTRLFLKKQANKEML